MPAIFRMAQALGGNARGIVDFGAGVPIHRDEAGGLFDAAQPCADRRECREIVIAAVGDMGVAIERDIGDRELAGGEIFDGS